MQTMENEKYRLPKNKRRRIKSAFKDWTGSPNKTQRNILKEYKLGYSVSHNAHVRITYEGDEHKYLTTPLSPSDWRCGRKMAKTLIDLIEEIHEEKF